MIAFHNIILFSCCVFFANFGSQ